MSTARWYTYAYMDVVTGLLLFVFGLIIGSFLNVVAYRFRTGVSLTGRSHCTSCTHPLSWYELVPVYSFLAQRGLCVHCGSRISARYTLVELLTGAAFVAVGYAFIAQPLMLALNLVLVSLLIVIVVYDMRHMIIPDELVAYLGLVAVAYVGYELVAYRSMAFLLDAALGAMIPALFLAGLWYISSGRWIGLGDVKLSIPLGALLGAWGSVSFVIFAFWIGAGVSLAVLAVQRVAQRMYRGQQRLRFFSGALTMKSEVPFAPFLIVAFVLMHLSGADVFALVDTIIARLSF